MLPSASVARAAGPPYVADREGRLASDFRTDTRSC